MDDMAYKICLELPPKTNKTSWNSTLLFIGDTSTQMGGHFQPVMLVFRLHLEMLTIKNTCTWYPKQTCFYGCFNWMIPNLYVRNCCFTQHSLWNCLFRVPWHVTGICKICTTFNWQAILSSNCCLPHFPTWKKWMEHTFSSKWFLSNQFAQELVHSLPLKTMSLLCASGICTWTFSTSNSPSSRNCNSPRRL